jgi:hypothetical protein
VEARCAGIDLRQHFSERPVVAVLGLFRAGRVVAKVPPTVLEHRDVRLAG